MILVMKPGATEQEIQHAVERIEEKGLKTILLRGTNRNVIAAIGDKREIPVGFWQAIPGVEKAVPILAPYKMASRELKPTPSQVPVGKHLFGGTKIGVIAGPCAVESHAQTLSVARAVKEAGAVALRGGAFKPRTSPYKFQGLMEDGLRVLADVGREVGLPIITEVISAQDVDTVAEYADALQIGARNMQNFLLLKAAGKVNKPILLKRGFSATMDEFLLAAEYILSEGNDDVILCERGIRTFETHTRFTLALTTVPYLKQSTHLPVIVDPSHSTGASALVAPMARGAIAVGADGLIVEVHPDPENAMVDGAQSLTPAQFADMMLQIGRVAAAVDRKA
jgi:3-deoxy-7-phosphoheptulonate synthase